MSPEMRQCWTDFERTRAERHRNQLVESYLPLVRDTATRMLTLLPETVELEDLESAGTLGLIDAIQRFRPERGVKFESFCRPRIRGAILDELRGWDRFSRSLRVRIQQVDRGAESLKRKLRRVPTERELADFLGLRLKDVTKFLHRKGISVYSLDALRLCGETGEEANLMELVPDERGLDPVKEVQAKELTDLAESLLSKVERQVVMLYYYDQLTLREIGEMLGLTESRVCQIHTRVMKRLRQLLA